MAVDSVSDGARLLARGAPITLQGQALRLIFDFEALEYLEEEFGGLDVFVAHLREEKWKAHRLQSVRKGITAGLFHTKPQHQEIFEFEREIRQMLDFKDFVDYLDALTLAIMEAMPAVKSDERPKAKRSASSRGRASTGTEPSASAAAIVSSGA